MTFTHAPAKRTKDDVDDTAPDPTLGLPGAVGMPALIVRRSTGILPPHSLGPVVAGLVVVNILTIIIGIGLGSVSVEPSTVTEVIGRRLLGLDSNAPVHLQQIIWDLRAPRVLLAAIVGAALALSGVTIQALVRNPIADPYVLGVSSGASVGATLVLLFGAFGGLGSGALTGAAFVTAVMAMILVYVLAQGNGALDPLRLVLTGVVAGYVFSGLTSFLVFRGDPRAAQQVMFWLLGSFGRARWSMLIMPALALGVALVHLAFRSRSMDVMLSGDEAATTLGINVRRTRLELFIATAALTAVMVAVSGAVGFVGLVIPHTVRFLTGSGHRRVLPTATLLGSAFMMWVDIASRTLASPQEIPLGIITAVVGGPVFIMLMRHQQRRMSLR